MVPEQENPHTPDGTELEPVSHESTPDTTVEEVALSNETTETEPVAEALVAETPAEPVVEAAEAPVVEAAVAEPVEEAAVAEPVVEAAVAEPVVEEHVAVAHVAVPEVEEAAADEHAEEAAEEEDLPVVEYTEDRGEGAASSLLQEILGDEESLDSVVDKASPLELCLLMESIATRGDVAEFVAKIAHIKKSFDSKIDPETVETALMSRFTTAMARFNKKRMAYYAQREKEKEENSNKKKELLERLKAIVTEEQVTKIAEVREIQTQWREVGWVMQKDLQSFNETYRHYLDIFYKLRSQYQELLDMDRKHNLDEKKRIIDEIERLMPEDDQMSRDEWNKRSDRVKALQEFWRTIGHVPREDQEALNSSFRDVLDRFYEMRSGYYEVQDAQKGENAEKKRALLDRLKAMSAFEGGKPKDWNDLTKEILELQEEWKKIGPGPADQNKELWKEYRAMCDTFFNRKQEFFKGFDDERGDNLVKKTAICERAEAVMNSDDYKETAEILKQLQEEWKSIGPVHDRYSNKIWKRFRQACDTFFERKSATQSAAKTELDENLRIKLDLISQVEAIVAGDNPGAHAEEFEAIQAKWKETGHVPFKQKDKINGAYRDALKVYYDKVRGSGGGGPRRGGDDRRGGGFERRGGGGDRRGGGRPDHSTGDPVEDEMRKLRMKIQLIQEKVDQYETNILFISKGKSGDALRQQIQGQIDKEKIEIERAKQRIRDLKAAKEAPVAPVEEAPAPEEGGEGEA